MERRRPVLGCAIAVVFSAAVWAVVFWAWGARASTWRDAPPERYQRDAFVYVQYVPYADIPAMCGIVRPGIVGCGFLGGGIVMPAECSPTRRPMARFERIVVADLGRSYCDRLKLHEVGHVNGWTDAHED
jgi:hypothetical protein